jgi:hypothetical protein
MANDRDILEVGIIGIPTQLVASADEHPIDIGIRATVSAHRRQCSEAGIRHALPIAAKPELYGPVAGHPRGELVRLRFNAIDGYRDQSTIETVESWNGSDRGDAFVAVAIDVEVGAFTPRPRVPSIGRARFQEDFLLRPFLGISRHRTWRFCPFEARYAVCDTRRNA